MQKITKFASEKFGTKKCKKSMKWLQYCKNVHRIQNVKSFKEETLRIWPDLTFDGCCGEEISRRICKVLECKVS